MGHFRPTLSSFLIISARSAHFCALVSGIFHLFVAILAHFWTFWPIWFSLPTWAIFLDIFGTKCGSSFSGIKGAKMEWNGNNIQKWFWPIRWLHYIEQAPCACMVAVQISKHEWTRLQLTLGSCIQACATWNIKTPWFGNFIRRSCFINCILNHPISTTVIATASLQATWMGQSRHNSYGSGVSRSVPAFSINFLYNRVYG